MKRLMSRGVRVWLGSLGLVGAGLVALHCSNTDDESKFPDAGGNDPCEVAYKGLCGVPCEADEKCAAGLYCRAGKCHADCSTTPRIQGTCPEGIACSPRGRCGTDPSDASLVDGGSDAKNDGTCAAIDVVVEKIVPTVLLLIDQSSSMEYDFTGANLMPPNFPNSRWVKLRESLMDPDGGIVKKYENDVEFGLALYGANNGNEKPPAVVECPIMKTVAFAKGNHAAISAVYSPELPIDDTPTPDAVLAAARSLARTRGCSLGEAVSELARRGLRHAQDRSAGSEPSADSSIGPFPVVIGSAQVVVTDALVAQLRDA